MVQRREKDPSEGPVTTLAVNALCAQFHASASGGVEQKGRAEEEEPSERWCLGSPSA